MTNYDDEDDFDGRNDLDAREALALSDLMKELEGMSPEELLRRSQKKLLVELLAKVEMGQASHQELAILRNLLRDNGIMLTPTPPPNGGPEGAPSAPPPASLPTYDDFEE